MKLEDSAISVSTKRILLENGCFLQVGALVYRLKEQEKEYEILLITSRKSGRWIIPKGWPMPGHTLARSAQIEAYEEAGVQGRVDKKSCGDYFYEKQDMPLGNNNRFQVAIFAVLYQGQKKSWPEMGQRLLEWVCPDEAAKRVDEADLKEILANFSPPSCL